MFFVHFLSKFYTVFSIQNIPTKFCLENIKVTEIFLQSIKVDEFLFIFPLQIVKGNCLNAIK